jgi:predicted RNA binding protein YcfA (HicA-like mRNA interferase family)
MKRLKLIQYLESHGCHLLREGGNHSLYYNPGNNSISTIPRHVEIKKFIARKICKDLGINPFDNP